MNLSRLHPGGLAALGGELPSPRTSGSGAGPPTRKAEQSWQSKDYRPHWDLLTAVRSITLRLCDSLPPRLGNASPKTSEPAPTRILHHDSVPELSERVEALLDVGRGRCWLAYPAIAELVESTLLHFDPGRYRLLAWCIMPNHIHVLVEIRRGISVAAVVRAWKSYTAIRANRLLGRNGNFWQRNHLERLVRHAQQCRELIDQIEANPSRAGLVEQRAEWRWSSARFRLGAALGRPS